MEELSNLRKDMASTFHSSCSLLSWSNKKKITFQHHLEFTYVWMNFLIICIYTTYVLNSIRFQTFFTGIWNCHRFWKFSMLLLLILWDDWPIFMILRSNEQLPQQLEYTQLKPDCHSWWISKIQSDTLEEQYGIKFCFELGKLQQKPMECFRLLLDHLAWIEHQFLSGIRDSRKAGSLWGMMRGVGGVRKSEHKSWLAKGLGLLCWGSKGVQ